MVVPNYETTCKDQELIISRLEKENRFLREENQELKADYGTKAQVERDLLMEENQELKKQLEELELIVGLRQKRNLISKFNKEYDEEDKKKNPNRSHTEIIPDAEEVYKRYYEMKNQQKVFIQWLENKMNETHYTMFEFQAYHLAFEKYKEIIGVEKCEK